MVAGACVLPQGVSIAGINDSKQIDETERERLYEIITTTPGVVWAVAVLEHTVVDEINILEVPTDGVVFNDVVES